MQKEDSRTMETFDGKDRRKGKWFLALLRGSVGVFAVLLTLSQALAYMEHYRLTPTHTTFRVQEREEFRAPKISICGPLSRNPTRIGNESIADVLRVRGEYFTASLGACLLNIHGKCMAQRSKNTTNAAKMPQVASDINWDLRDTIPTESGEWSLNMWRGEDPFTMTSCYTFHPNRSMGILHDLSGYWFLLNFKSFTREVIGGGEREELTLPHKNEKSDMEKWEEIGEIPEWDLLLHRDLDWAWMRDGSATSFRIRAGISYEIRLTFKETININSKAYPCNPDLNYTRDKCYDDCIATGMSKEKISCCLPWMNLPSPICDRAQDVAKLVQIYRETGGSQGSFWKKFQSCHRNCLPACNRTVYVAQVQSHHDGRSSLKSRISVYVPLDTSEVLTEIPSYDITQMVGELGGCVGMFTGVSLISIYAFLERRFTSFLARRVKVDVEKG